eukprot:7803882-Pyramimonas_sp.AAC.1
MAPKKPWEVGSACTGPQASKTGAHLMPEDFGDFEFGARPGGSMKTAKPQPHVDLVSVLS